MRAGCTLGDSHLLISDKSPSAYLSACDVVAFRLFPFIPPRKSDMAASVTSLGTFSSFANLSSTTSYTDCGKCTSLQLGGE